MVTTMIDEKKGRRSEIRSNPAVRIYVRPHNGHISEQRSCFFDTRIIHSNSGLCVSDQFTH